MLSINPHLATKGREKEEKGERLTNLILEQLY